jgi:FkbM family methyltransferase
LTRLGAAAPIAAPPGLMARFQQRHRGAANRLRGLARIAGAAAIFGPASRLFWGLENRHLRDIGFSALRSSKARHFIVDGRESLVINCRDDVISREVFRSGSFDFHKFERAIAILQSRGLMAERVQRLFDIGANIGTICIPAVARGLAETAVAIEPHPINCRLLRANIAINGLHERIVVAECAAAALDGGEAMLEVNDRNWGDHRVAPAAQAVADEQGESARTRIAVPMRTIDSIAAETGPPTLLWMDTQGFEGFVLEGAARVLAARPPLVTEYWPYSLRRVGGYAAFHAAIAAYRHFIDLDAPGPVHDVADFESRYAGLSTTQGVDLLFLD